MRVIAMVAMQEGISQKDLAFLLGIRPQTLGEMLQKLEEHGLIERQKSEEDGRVIEVRLTEQGRELAAEIAERRKLVAADLFAVLSEEEKEQLASILDKLTVELEKYRPRRPKHEGEPEGESEPEA
jgi:DNA-binding MarR family transcriptional regulator